MNQILFNFFYGFAHHSPRFDAVLIFMGGSIFSLAIFLGVLAYFIFINKKRKMYWTSMTLVALAGSWIVANVLKIIFAIPRPFVGSDTIVPLITADGYSLPSSHAAVFAALAVVVFSYSKKRGIPFILLAILVGLSRIVQGVHTPLDVLIGWAVGALVGIVVSRFFKRHL
jgi:membrane-associated phospholipid phosphatase